MEQVKLYDTTLRDGMGGRGMSLSVGEKLKVAQALDALGVHFIEAGFPSSNPKEAELFERLAEVELENATIVAFGMTRRRDSAAAEDEALAVLTVVLRARGLPRRQELAAPRREGDPGQPRGEPGDDRRLDRLLPRAGQAADLRRRALLRRLPRRQRLRARMRGGGGRRRGRERHPLRHQRRQPAELRRRGDRGRRRGRRPGGRDRDPHPRRLGLRGGQLAGGGGSRRPPGAGLRQRLRRALRQRQPGLDPAGAAAEDGLRGGHAPSSWRA